ncbi:Mini-ribonuclease 3 [Synechocystis sp. PCC 7509]|uniref:Mini-ribonuclease 3 n=1 Tax=Synechocystis sp. PCC 7509 TaxID=927677 RepID=UPI000A0387DE
MANLISMNPTQIQQVSPAALAYIGDAVYELYIRANYLLPPKTAHAYHQLVVAQVRAETQALQLASLVTCLTATELEIVRRGRNAANRPPKRVDAEIYGQATSLEALIGYLYLTNFPRLSQLLQKLNLLEPEVKK